MDSKTQFGGEDLNPVMCGEESFGTGSNHIREKDGLWAVSSKWFEISVSFDSVVAQLILAPHVLQYLI